MPAAQRANPEKRETIIRAATVLFNRYGYRRTTVELIAQEAAVAKPTLYSHFADKDAIFSAVCQSVMDGILAAAAAEAARPDLIARIAGVVAAKFTTIFELVESSPHARELLESQDAVAREIVARADAAYVKLLTDTLRAAVRAGELEAASPAKLTRLLMQAGHGASYGAKSAAEHRDNVRALVAALLAPAQRP